VKFQINEARGRAAVVALVVHCFTQRNSNTRILIQSSQIHFLPENIDTLR